MALKYKEANPLAVANMRRMDWCPPHFQAMTIVLRNNEKQVTDWIFENTEGRFYFGPGSMLQDTRYVSCTRIAFEVHSECSYFAMLLSTIDTADMLIT